MRGLERVKSCEKSKVLFMVTGYATCQIFVPAHAQASMRPGLSRPGLTQLSGEPGLT